MTCGSGISFNNFRKRRSASYIVREVRLVRERERERERERDRETDGSDVTLVVLKLAMSFALFLAKNLHLSNWRRVLHFSLPKICTLVSPLFNGADFTLSVSKNVVLFETNPILCKIRILHFASVKTIVFPAALSFFFSKKCIKLIPKTIGKRKKEIVREVALSGKTPPEKICRSKSTNQEGFRSAPRTDLCFSICRFSQVLFIPRAQPHAQSLFSISNSFFSINLLQTEAKELLGFTNRAYNPRPQALACMRGVKPGNSE